MNTNTTPQLPIPLAQHEEHYSRAIAQIKDSSPPNPLYEKTPENIRDIAIILDKIVRFFYFENEKYLHEDKDYRGDILSALSELFNFLSKSGVDGIFEMYQNFKKSGAISDEMVYEKSRELFGTITKNDVPKFLEILFSPFGTLAGYREEDSHGNIQLQSFSAYGRLLGRGFLYPEHRLENIVRPTSEINALTFLMIDEPNTADIKARIPEDINAIMTTPVAQDTQEGAKVIPLSSRRITNNIITEVSPPLHPANLVPESTFGDITEVSHGEDQEEPSKAQEGQARRRGRDGRIKDKKEAQRTAQKNQEGYNGELRKLRALSLFLDERFEELRNFLLENIPYVTEVLDYIFTVNRLKEKGYEGNSLNVNTIQGEFEKMIHDYTRAIQSKEEENRRLEQSIATLADRLVNEDGPERSKLNKSIGKAQGKIERNATDITTYSREIASLQDESKDLFNNSTKYRLDQVPNREQFSLAFYHSLRAGELYSSPDYINETPVTEEWVRKNVLNIFIDILGTYLDEFHGVNIRDLSELQRKIDELPEEYSDDIALIDIESVSQRKVSDFFAMLYSIMPRDYLSEIPNLPTIITPEGTIETKTIITEEPKPRRSRSELRKQSHAKKAEKEEVRTKLIEELHRKEEELMEYVHYWKEKLVGNIRTRRAYFADIESIQYSIHRRRKYPTKGMDELETLIKENKGDEQVIREKIENGGLKTDEISYKSLVEDRAQIARKLSHLKR